MESRSKRLEGSDSLGGECGKWVYINSSIFQDMRTEYETEDSVVFRCLFSLETQRTVTAPLP